MENTDIKNKPFLSQNVWLKRLGLLLLICGLFPSLLVEYNDQIHWLGKTLIILVILTYIVKMGKDFIVSIWKS